MTESKKLDCQSYAYRSGMLESALRYAVDTMESIHRRLPARQVQLRAEITARIESAKSSLALVDEAEKAMLARRNEMAEA